MNDKQFKKINNFLAFSIIVCILWTAGNIGLFTIFSAEPKIVYRSVRPIELNAFNSELYFDDLILLERSLVSNCTIYTQFPLKIQGNDVTISYCNIYAKEFHSTALDVQTWRAP